MLHVFVVPTIISCYDKLWGASSKSVYLVHCLAILSFHSPNVRLRSDLKCKVSPYINILQENGCLYRDPCKVSPYINIIQENGCVYRDANKVSPYIKNYSCLYGEPCKVTPYIGILHKIASM